MAINLLSNCQSMTLPFNTTLILFWIEKIRSVKTALKKNPHFCYLSRSFPSCVLTNFSISVTRTVCLFEHRACTIDPITPNPGGGVLPGAQIPSGTQGGVLGPCQACGRVKPGFRLPVLDQACPFHQLPTDWLVGKYFVPLLSNIYFICFLYWQNFQVGEFKNFVCACWPCFCCVFFSFAHEACSM